MSTVSLAIFLVVIVGVAVTLARQVRWPYPIVLVIGGLLLGFVPGLPAVQLEPETVFLIFLPPLLYAAAWQTPFRDFRANLRPISLLAIGLVFTTTLLIGAVAHFFIPDMPWAVAFTLGAIVSSTDAVAATTILHRVGAPRRIVTILAGESLVNDAAALVAYRYAVIAVTTGAFAVWEAGLNFLVSMVGGVAIGLVVGVVSAWVFKKLDDPPVEILMSIVPAYAAYVAGEQLHVSGVLATVAAGLYIAYRSSSFMGSRTRIEAYAVWEIIEFGLNGLIFVLIGLQLREIRQGLATESILSLLGEAALISAAVIVVRILWVYPATYLPRLIPAVRHHDPAPSWQSPAVISWAGMRGVVSLATALALPLTLANGVPFPQRDRLIFLTFGVIFATLVLQGLSLGPLIRWLGIETDGAEERETAEAELRTAQAALARLDELQDEDWVVPEKMERLRGEYELRVQRLIARCDSEGAAQEYDQHRDGYHRLLRELLTSERTEAIRLRNTGVINDETLHRVEHSLDLAEVRLADTP